MTTAKELAFKAYCDALKHAVYELEKKEGKEYRKIDLSDVFNTFPDMSGSDLKQRFESRWSEWYGGDDHKDCFHKEHSVFIDLKTYIRAE